MGGSAWASRPGRRRPGIRSRASGTTPDASSGRRSATRPSSRRRTAEAGFPTGCARCRLPRAREAAWRCRATRSEEHTSELQSLAYLVCRLLLEKKKKKKKYEEWNVQTKRDYMLEE